MATHHITAGGEEFTLPQGTVNLMREWVLDCEWGEDAEYLSRMNAQQLATGIERHYAGGFAQFLRDSMVQA